MGRTGADPEGTGALGRASRGEALGRTGADPAGTGALERASRGEALGSTGANPAGTGAWETSLGEVAGRTGARSTEVVYSVRSSSSELARTSLRPSPTRGAWCGTSSTRGGG